MVLLQVVVVPRLEAQAIPRVCMQTATTTTTTAACRRSTCSTASQRWTRPPASSWTPTSCQVSCQTPWPGLCSQLGGTPPAPVVVVGGRCCHAWTRELVVQALAEARAHIAVDNVSQRSQRYTVQASQRLAAIHDEQGALPEARFVCSPPHTSARWSNSGSGACMHACSRRHRGAQGH